MLIKIWENSVDTELGEGFLDGIPKQWSVKWVLLQFGFYQDENFCFLNEPI